MAGTDITEAVFSSGQNEGVERSILPLPQLSFVQNARQRKSGRWGKRFGTTALAALNSSGNVLGSGSGLVRAIGKGFCVVDDQCAIYDQAGQGGQGIWVDPKPLTGANTTSPACLSPRIQGAVSGWLPDKAYFPVPPLSQQFPAGGVAASTLTQQMTPCSQTYGIGYLWSAIQIIDPNNVSGVNSDCLIRIVATNPTDQSLVFLQDIRAAAFGFGGNIYPKLLTSGNTVVLTYITQPGHAAGFTAARSLTTLAGSFGAEVSLIATGTSLIYDSAPLSATQFLLATATSAAIVNTGTLSVAVGRAGTAAPNGVSIVGATGVRIFRTASGAGVTTVDTFDAALAALLASTVVDAAEPATYTAYCALLPNGGARCVFGYIDDVGANPRHFSWRDLTTAGALASGLIGRQYRYQPMSRPITIGGQVYLWVTTKDVVAGFGYATLLRLPALAEFPALAGTANYLSCPLEMSPQDFLVGTSNANFGGGTGSFQRGLPPMVQIGASATYSLLAPVLMSVPDITVQFEYQFRGIQLKHYTDLPGPRALSSVPADSANFIPMGALTRIGPRGATEEGFCLAPSIYSLTPSVTGTMVAGTYLYVAVFKSRNERGLFEVSAPSAVSAPVVLAGGFSGVSVAVLQLDVSARASTQIELYRNLGAGTTNGTIFYYVGTFDGSAQSGQTAVFLDTEPDTTIRTHPVLYTQVGQTLPNCFPPPSRFAAVGSQRVFLGGLLRGDVIHASKSILGDQSPSWADQDAFRIVMPSTVTGLAWMDNLLIFTDEGVYVVAGDGPDDSGNGEFSPPVRLPFALGCIEPRSVITVDEGTFFQTARGLYMVPRGFGSPVPAGDTVLDTLASFPIITGTAALLKATEQTIRWSCVNAANPQFGAQIVYDLAHKSWSVDFIGDPSLFGGVPAQPHISICTWLSGEIALAEPTIAGISFKTTSSKQDLVPSDLFSDSGMPYSMSLRTGDLRPFGVASEGVLSKIDTLTELRSACTLTLTKITEWGTASADRVFALAAGDTQVGQLSYVETEMGNTELRDAVSVQLQWDEFSAVEGVVLIAMALEHEQGEGLKRVSPLSRAT